MTVVHVLASTNPSENQLEKDVHAVFLTSDAPAEFRERIALDVFRAAVPEMDVDGVYLKIVGDDGRCLSGQDRENRLSDMPDASVYGSYGGIVDPSDLPFEHDVGHEASGPGI